jgi:hypothetical protein
MTIRIKNWSEHQHFKDRRPPWIKVHREIIDDIEWHELSGDDAKLLISLWLIASEDKELSGKLPEVKSLCFRLRIKEIQLNQALIRLSHWLIHDDINEISSCHQDDITEKRREEIETETETDNGFALFWSTYPDIQRKQSKSKCHEIWIKKKLSFDKKRIVDHVENLKSSGDWTKENGQYVPAPLVYLNQRRWDGAEIIKSTSNLMAGAI